MATETAVKERPILFNAEMVRAILDGRKTQTRRVIKPQPLLCVDNLTRCYCWPSVDESEVKASWALNYNPTLCMQRHCPHGQPGDRLWVRETFRVIPEYRPAGYFTDPELTGKDYWYKATDHLPTWGNGPWKPSIHMPRWASRITLEITDVRVERVQDISEEDARHEGITDGGCLNCGETEPCNCPDPSPSAVDTFVRLWTSINGEESWNDNPWVWVVEFRQV